MEDDLWDRIPFDPKERLSVTLMRDHVQCGHRGKYEHYCYRCEWFEAERSAADWQLAAIEKRRFWAYPRGERTGRIGFGDDEYQRRTFYVGRLVMALWRCRCADCRADLDNIRATARTDRGQEDRDKQRAVDQ